MRLRNIPGADEIIAASPYVIPEHADQKGRWRETFGNDQPIHIEIGMGKGKFLMTMAAQHPEINYIGIERYTSVLLRAVQKMEENPVRNLLFICMDVVVLPEMFDLGEVDRIYLNFSVPCP